MDVLDELLALDGVRATAPAPPSQVSEVARWAGVSLPGLLVRLWRRTDGLTLKPIDAHIVGPGEVLELARAGWGERVGRDFLPIVDDHQSNYCAVVIEPPLAFRVAHVPHDDAPRLLYTGVASCLRAIVDGMRSRRPLDRMLHESHGDFAPDGPRSPEDQAAARALLATDGTHREWNHAAGLLDGSDIDGFTRLLETDHFVRRDVLARLRQMTSPAVQGLLRRDQEQFARFADLVVAAARTAGLRVGALREQHVLEVNGHWIELETFYHRRGIRDALPRMIAWIDDLVAGRDPHQRPGHFHED
jgi:hypothetical protein